MPPGDRVAFLDGPFDGGDAAMPGQQRGVIADTAKFRGGQRLPGDAGMAVGGYDQVGVGRDFRRDDEFRVGLHHDLDPGGARGRGETILAVVDDDANDIDAALAQHVECRHAEMAGTDQGNPHMFRPSLVRPICR